MVGYRQAGSGLLSVAAARDKPNVLFIAVDDLNDWVGALGGHPAVRTPSIDQLASRGLLFTRAYSAAPSCNPSRTALLTGIRPSTSGVYGNGQPMRDSLPDAVTLPQHFMANGYHVVGGGKIFHRGGQHRDEWHEWWGNPESARPPKTPLSTVDYSITDEAMDFGPLDARDEEMVDYKIAQQAIDYLKKKHDRPFFLASCFVKPHLPWFVPRKYFDLYPLDQMVLPLVNDNDLDDVPPIAWRWANIERRHDHKAITSTGNWEKAVQAYLASITFVDTQVGRVLNALEESPYAENTVIVLWGDHGYNLGEKLTWRKVNLWEEANRTPLIFLVPGMTRPGSRCPRPVSLMDLYPTLVEVCGLTPAPGKQEGVSLLPLLKDSQAAWERPALMTWRRGNHSVRSERWRYTRYADGTEELYDHEFDPLEWKNLAVNPYFQSIKKKLAKWLPTYDAPEAPELFPVPGSPDFGKRVKAGFLSDFIRLVKWPLETFGGQPKPIVFCLIGKDPFGPILEQFIETEKVGKVKGRPLMIRRLASLEELKPCHVVFISPSENSQVEEILRALQHQSVLTVGETEGFLHRGGAINFITDQGTVRFEINVDAAEQADLKLISQLLKMAHLVRRAAR